MTFKSLPQCSLAILFALICFKSAQADVVYIVSDLGAGDPMVAFVNSNFSNVTSVTTSNYITGPPNATVDDIVIFSRTTNSGNYSNSLAEIDAWNGLEADVLMMSAFLLRGSRFGWTDDEGLNQPSTAGAETTVVVSDPLLAGVSGSSIDLFNVNGVGSGLDRAGGAGGVGGGTVLATIGTSNVLARYNAGSALADTTPGGFTTTQVTHGGNRIFMPFQVGPSPVSDHLTADGQIVLTNALVEFGLVANSSVPEPTSGLAILFGTVLVSIRRRRV